MPDVVNKGWCSPNFYKGDRYVAHNLLALSLSSNLAVAWSGSEASVSWSIGYVLQLVEELPFSGHMPRFFLLPLVLD